MLFLFSSLFFVFILLLIFDCWFLMAVVKGRLSLVVLVVSSVDKIFQHIALSVFFSFPRLIVKLLTTHTRRLSCLSLFLCAVVSVCRCFCRCLCRCCDCVELFSNCFELRRALVVIKIPLVFLFSLVSLSLTQQSNDTSSWLNTSACLSASLPLCLSASLSLSALSACCGFQRARVGQRLESSFALTSNY